MDAVKKQILESLLDIIDGIADRDYQKRVWIEGKGPEVDDFDETVCNFHDIGESIFTDSEKYDLSHNQLCLLKKLSAELDSICDLYGYDSPYEVIDSSDWMEVTKLAKEILSIFGYEQPIYIKLNKSEFNYLKSAPFILSPLFLADHAGEYILKAQPKYIHEIQNLCRKQFELVGYDESNSLTQEGHLLISTLKTLDRKEPPILLS